MHKGPIWASCDVFLSIINQYIIYRMQKCKRLCVLTKILKNLVQKWACKNEFIDLINIKTSKNKMIIRVSHFKSILTIFTQKSWMIFLATQFRRNCEFYTKKLVIKIINLTTHIWSKIQYLQLLFPHQVQIVPPSCILQQIFTNFQKRRWIGYYRD